jgi:hypothetical protein
VKGRRPSSITVANNLRSFVKAWRKSEYAGASDTTRELLFHWFERDHVIETPTEERIPFCYYFCQREAIESLIYLWEVRGQRSLSNIISEFGGEDRKTAALGVNPDEDRWAKYAFKLATGTGKTKVMSLAIVWSYFHALRESDSPMAKHFAVIAPNLTVFERLKEDFGNGVIFDKDPLIPVAWREAASQEREKWTYLYVPQAVFEDLTDNKVKILMQMCKPSLQHLLNETMSPQLSLPFGEPEPEGETQISVFLSINSFRELPSRYQKAVEQAVALYHFLKNKDDVSFAPVFTPLLGPLDEAARGMILRELKGYVLADRSEQNAFFHPDLTDLPTGEANFHKRRATNLERTLVDQNGLMPIGLLCWCLDYVQTTRRKTGGIFEVVRTRFADVS